MLPNESPQKKLFLEVSQLLHSEKPFEASKLVAEWVRQTGAKIKDPTTKKDAFELLHILLHWALNNGAMEEAAGMLWSPSQFDPRPDSTQRVWKAFEENPFILLMGAASMSKSFSMAIRLFLEWIRDPEFTNIKVLGPSEDHLESNLFTHLVTLHRSSTIPLPGEVGKLFIGLDARSRKGSISGVVIPLGKKAAGRLQGVKRVPRKKPHPIFGLMSRLFIFMDEIANIPVGIFRDCDNLMSNTAGANDSGFKIIGAFNPTNQSDEVGTRCEPSFGWPSFDPDKHFEWISTRGWFVVRLDAARSENVLAGKTIYPGLQTKEGFDRIILNSGGTDSFGYWAMARGCFPPQGTILSIIPSGMLNKFKAEIIWYDTPRPCGGVDLALEGSDSAKFAHGKWGLATGIKYAPTLEHPNGVTVMFKNKNGRAYPRFVLWLAQIFPLPKGDTPAMYEAVKKLAQQLGITPEWLCVDRTGNGSGVHDLLKHNWGIGCQGVNFGEGCSESRIMVEDSDTADKLYPRKDSELMFALRKFIEFGYFFANPALDTTELYPQMTERLFRMVGKVSKVESKKDYKSRHQGKSPDDCDGVSLLVQAVRTASGILPGMSHDNTFVGDSEGDYYESETSDCDITNRFSELDL